MWVKFGYLMRATSHSHRNKARPTVTNVYFNAGHKDNGSSDVHSFGGGRTLRACGLLYFLNTMKGVQDE
jgi:hypothetical protein